MWGFSPRSCPAPKGNRTVTRSEEARDASVPASWIPSGSSAPVAQHRLLFGAAFAWGSTRQPAAMRKRPATWRHPIRTGYGCGRARARIDVDDQALAHRLGEIDLAAERGGQRDRGHARTRQVVRGAVIDRDGEVGGQGPEVRAHRPMVASDVGRPGGRARRTRDSAKAWAPRRLPRDLCAPPAQSRHRPGLVPCCPGPHPRGHGRTDAGTRQHHPVRRAGVGAARARGGRGPHVRLHVDVRGPHDRPPPFSGLQTPRHPPVPQRRPPGPGVRLRRRARRQRTATTSCRSRVRSSLRWDRGSASVRQRPSSPTFARRSTGPAQSRDRGANSRVSTP